MLLTNALLRSKYGIATRRRSFMSGGRKQRFEYHMAAATPSGKVFILNGRSGIVSPITAVDQAREDWEPYLVRVEVKRRRHVATLKDVT